MRKTLSLFMIFTYIVCIFVFAKMLNFCVPRTSYTCFLHSFFFFVFALTLVSLQCTFSLLDPSLVVEEEDELYFYLQTVFL